VTRKWKSSQPSCNGFAPAEHAMAREIGEISDTGGEMKRIVLIAVLGACCLHAETVFHKCHVSVGEGKKSHDVQADLAFTDAKELVVRYPGKKKETVTVAEIPFTQIDKMDYEFSKHHRIGTGAAVMAASLGAGAIIMATKSTSHWFNVDYHDGSESKNLLLKLDKGEYQHVLETAESQTGKKVDRAVKAGKDPSKKKISGD
jgi:hypothetical protein